MAAVGVVDTQSVDRLGAAGGYTYYACAHYGPSRLGQYHRSPGGRLLHAAVLTMAIPTVAGGWLLHAEHVCVVDHHPAPGDIKPDESIIEPVGSATTILVERIRTLAQAEALRTLTLTLTLTLTVTTLAQAEALLAMATLAIATLTMATPAATTPA